MYSITVIKLHYIFITTGWFILTNLGSLSEASATYQKWMGIEESYLNYKSGRYYLEGTGLKGQRLLALILVNSTRL